MKKYKAKVVLKRNGEEEIFEFKAPTDKDAKIVIAGLFPTRLWDVKISLKYKRINRIKVVMPCLN